MYQFLCFLVLSVNVFAASDSIHVEKTEVYRAVVQSLRCSPKDLEVIAENWGCSEVRDRFRPALTGEGITEVVSLERLALSFLDLNTKSQGIVFDALRATADSLRKRSIAMFAQATTPENFDDIVFQTIKEAWGMPATEALQAVLSVYGIDGGSLESCASFQDLVSTLLGSDQEQIQNMIILTYKKITGAPSNEGFSSDEEDLPATAAAAAGDGGVPSRQNKEEAATGMLLDGFVSEGDEDSDGERASTPRSRGSAEASGVGETKDSSA